MYHWEKCDLTCNSKKVTDTQTDDKVPFESKPQAAHEIQDEVLFFFNISYPDDPDTLYSF